MPPTRGADGGKRVLWRTYLYNQASNRNKKTVVGHPEAVPTPSDAEESFHRAVDDQ